MVHGNSRDLTRAEQSYVAQVERQLRGQPDGQRSRLVHSLRQRFLAGQPSDTYARIERELGTPADYAASLTERQAAARSDPRPAAPARSGSTTALWTTLAVVVVVIVVVAIVLMVR